MSKKRIGFGAYGDDDQEPEEVKKPDHFRDYITENFNAESGEMELFTSLELQYHLNEQFFVSIRTINDTLAGLGYKQKNILGEVSWVLYKKINL